jgi:hypothetical protein
MRELSKEEIENLRDVSDIVSWCYISAHKNLSEGFIKEFSDKVVWKEICFYQVLSEGFIREFCDKVDWNCVMSFRNKYIKKHKNISISSYKRYET